MPEPRTPQLAVLQLVLDGRSPFDNLHDRGASTSKGEKNTARVAYQERSYVVAECRRHGWLDHDNQLTPAGTAQLAGRGYA